MKTALLALVGCLAAMPASGGSTPGPPTVLAIFTVGDRSERVQGSGRIVEDRREVAAFGAIHQLGPVDVQLKAAERDSVTVRADDNIAALITTRVTGGERPALEIGLQPGAAFRTARTPVVIVEFRALSELVIRGSGDVHADRIVTDDFALSMLGSGDVKIDWLQSKRLAAVLVGSGDLVVGGQAEHQAYRISGSGDVRAGELEGRSVQISIAGSGNARVHATETLDVSIRGSGDVLYQGDAKVTRSIRGSGEVRKARSG
jgi:hypothetical protein